MGLGLNVTFREDFFEASVGLGLPFKSGLRSLVLDEAMVVTMGGIRGVLSMDGGLNWRA